MYVGSVRLRIFSPKAAQMEVGEMRTLSPIVSVVIPTHNRHSSLSRTLEALNRQTIDADAFEVIVVADGCHDSTGERVRAFGAPYRLFLLEQPGLGAAAARNLGAAKATGRFLLFLDDDVEPTPDLIAVHVRSHQNRIDRVVLGPYFPVLEGPAPFHRIIVRRWWREVFRGMSRLDHRFGYRDFLTGNVSLGRQPFLDLGGFDEAFRGCGAEDWEFGVRAIRAGLTFRFADDAVAYHHEHETTDLDRLFSRSRQEGRGEVMIGVRHPELRSTLQLARYGRYRRWQASSLVRLAFRAPSLGDRLAGAVRRLLTALEWARLRRRWHWLFGVLHQYWYLRGAAEKLGSLQELDRFVCESPPLNELPGPRIEVDLSDGMEAALRRIEETRPVAITVNYGALELARIPPVPGAERIRSRHFKSLLLLQFEGSAFSWFLSPVRSRSSKEAAESNVVVSGGIEERT